MTQVSRRTALEMQEGKAAEFTVIFALDHYRQIYRAQMSLMLGGMPYSRIVMDNALENIMKIAFEEESHIRYGELAEDVAREAAEIDEWLPPDEIAVRLDTFSIRNDGKWMPNASDDDGADDRPSTQMREHGPY